MDEPVASKGRIPLAELQIGGNDQAFPFAVVKNHLETQSGSTLVERDKASFTNDKSFCLQQSSKERVKRSLLLLGKPICLPSPLHIEKYFNISSEVLTFVSLLFRYLRLAFTLAKTVIF